MFFSEAIALIKPKLCINHWKVLYKLCVFYVDQNSKMTTTAGHSFYIGPIGSFYNQVNDTGSWEPLVSFFITYAGMIFFQLFNWFQLFSSREKLQKVAGHNQNRSKIDHLKVGVDGFSYFLLSLLFYFLTRIIPAYDRPCIVENTTLCRLIKIK